MFLPFISISVSSQLPRSIDSTCEIALEILLPSYPSSLSFTDTTVLLVGLSD